MAVQAWQAIIELLPSGIVVLDAKGCVIAANPVAESLLGLQLTGAAWIDVINTAFAPRGDDGHEVSLANGRKVSIATRSLPENSGQLIVMTDLTETRALQDFLNRRQRLAEMGEMTARIAHQVRTPVATALLYANLLKSDEISKSKHEQYNEKLIDALHAVENQMQDMLSYAKGERPMQTITKFNVNSLLNDLQYRMAGTLHHHATALLIEQTEEPIYIQGHRESLLGALENLVDNAIQASPEHAKIDVYCRAANDHQVTIGVRDHGCGMKAEDHQKICQPFFTTKPQGTGLGLTVVEAVAKAHQGKVVIQSSEGIGTDVAIRLPIMQQSIA